MSQERQEEQQPGGEFGIAPCLQTLEPPYTPGPYSSAEKQSCSPTPIRRHVSPLAGLAQNKLFNRVGEPFFLI